MNQAKKEHIVITGGSGLVGTYLSKELLKGSNYRVTIVDLNKPSVKGVEFVRSSFATSSVMIPLLKKADYLFHLAAMVGVDNCRLNPKEVVKVNYTDTKKLIDWCTGAGIKKIIFTSSSEIYGNSKPPFKENAKPSPISEYAKCKLKIEEYLKKIQATTATKSVVVRFFNVYGPGQKEMVIPLFAKAASTGKPLTVLGDGTQTRSFMYVTDAAVGIKKAFDFKGGFEIFNIGSSEEIKIIDLARLVLKNFPNSKSKIVFAPYGGKNRDRGLEVFRRVPSVTKSKRMLHFEAKVKLVQGLKKYLGLV